jgi:hypothetical protein
MRPLPLCRLPERCCARPMQTRAVDSGTGVSPIDGPDVEREKTSCACPRLSLPLRLLSEA